MSAPPALQTVALAGLQRPTALWAEVASRSLTWLRERDVSPRDAVLLLPFAALLPPARQAFAEAGRGAAWQARIETVQTLAASLGPAGAVLAADLARGPCGDPALDHLAATALLRSQDWARDWMRRDRRGFDHAVASLVEAATALARGAAAQAPQARAAWWDHARETLVPVQAGPGGTEAALARMALEWATLADTGASDRLFAHRAGAWLLVQLGGPDPLAQALLAQADGRGEPALVWLTDAVGADPFDAGPFNPRTDGAEPGQVLQWLADDAEDEAQACASAVIQAVDEGATPVALVAEDRLQVRRVRALLERTGLAVHDETGWTLATTRAAAQVMALLKAAAPAAGPDAWLDWLKAATPEADVQALQQLELCWRRQQSLPPGSAAQLLWRAASAQWQPLASAGRQRVGAWLQALRVVLDSLAADAPWQRDAAALQVRSALRLDAPPADALMLDLAGFTAFVDTTLERSVFTPPPGPPLVVVTPLARAIGRPFALAVLPGADHRRLGGAGPGPALLPEALLQRLGLPDRAARQRQRAAALLQLSRLPRLLLLRRRADGDEPLGASTLVQRLDLARRAGGWPGVQEAPAQRAMRRVDATPVAPPLPAAAKHLPAQLSASGLQALRDCPYRFFARAVLRLRKDEELDSDADARDQGNWMHAVLHRFHASRGKPLPAAAEVARLVALADEVAADPTVTAGLDAADLLPFRAGLEPLAQHYIAWLHQRDAEGWHWRSGETEHQVAPAALGGMRLVGRIDRIDDGASGQVAVLDYKTGAPESLKRDAAAPLDAVQLAFYSLLLAAEPVAQVAYVTLDRKGVASIAPVYPPPMLADALLAGLGDEWQRLRAGAAMPALGSGDLCDHCEARGLCRRDHWRAS